MAIYGDNKHDNGRFGKSQNNNGMKAKENKAKLVNEIIQDLWENLYESEEYIKDLLFETLIKRTQKDLKDTNN